MVRPQVGNTASYATVERLVKWPDQLTIRPTGAALPSTAMLASLAARAAARRPHPHANVTP
jgi:hypothetical protein